MTPNRGGSYPRFLLRIRGALHVDPLEPARSLSGRWDAAVKTPLSVVAVAVLAAACTTAGPARPDVAERSASQPVATASTVAMSVAPITPTPSATSTPSPVVTTPPPRTTPPRPPGGQQRCEPPSLYSWGGGASAPSEVRGAFEAFGQFDPDRDRVREVAAGGAHSVVLTRDGSVWTWGDDDEGQLGIWSEGIAGRSRPAPVRVSALSGVSAIAAGGKHSLALTNVGGIEAWGSNTFGQLGDGSTTGRRVPVPVADPFGGAPWREISAGLVHSLALKADGTVWAWGNNQFGQLGDGSTVSRLTPIRVGGPTRVVGISAGGTHSLALTEGGEVWACGLDLSVEQKDVARPVLRTTAARVAGLSDVTAIAAGGVHALALRRDGTAWAWGSNDQGQLGNGTRTNSVVPVRVLGLVGATAISAGGDFSLALTRDGAGDGAAWAWGDNLEGQLGDGSKEDRSSPVPVVGLREVGRVSAGLNARSLARACVNGCGPPAPARPTCRPAAVQTTAPTAALSYKHTQPGVQSELYMDVMAGSNLQVTATASGPGMRQTQLSRTDSTGRVRVTWVITEFGTYEVTVTVSGVRIGGPITVQ